MKYTIQDEIGKHFLDRAIKLVEEGTRLCLSWTI